MTWKRILYALFVGFIAITSGTAGVIVGGRIILALNRTDTGRDVQTFSNAPTQLKIADTQIETTITGTVEQVGPAVVTVVGTIPGQASFLGRTT